MINKKQYFNNNNLITKNLIVRINYALLGFYLCHFKSIDVLKDLIVYD